jgi:hypothetical protein
MRTAMTVLRNVVLYLASALLVIMCAAGSSKADEPQGAPDSRRVVVIHTANPYRFDVRLEVKCDWDWRRKAYRLHQWFVVPGKKQTMIKVPSSLKSCEIWPKLIW